MAKEKERKKPTPVKEKRRKGKRQVRELRSLLTSSEASALRKARRRTTEGKTRTGIKQWAMQTELKNKQQMIDKGLLPAPPTKKEDEAAGASAE